MPDGHPYSDTTIKRAQTAHAAFVDMQARTGVTEPPWEKLVSDEQLAWIHAVYVLDMETTGLR